MIRAFAICCGFMPLLRNCWCGGTGRGGSCGLAAGFAARDSVSACGAGAAWAAGSGAFGWDAAALAAGFLGAGCLGAGALVVFLAIDILSSAKNETIIE